MNTLLTHVDDDKNQQHLKASSMGLHRVASLTPAEAFVLHGLLVDNDAKSDSVPNGHLEKAGARKRLDDDILFSIMPPTVTAAPTLTTSLLGGVADSQQPQQQQHSFPRPLLPPSHRKANRHSTVGLWKAHQDGVAPDRLRSKSLGCSTGASNSDLIDDICITKNKKLTIPDVSPPLVVTTAGAVLGSTAAAPDAPAASSSGDFADSSEHSIASDVEVRPEHHRDSKKTDGSNDEDSIAASSWDEAEHTENFDAWEVLRDEYAQDFGFDYSQRQVTMESIVNGSDENEGNTFAILGTSVNDTSAQPHVLSPPLMDALQSIIGQTLVPELNGQNFWLRYSLIRDGASIQTLKQYVRAAKYTILAIETRSGYVFGSFTSSPWRNALSYFGGPPAFVWKMRHSRRTRCASLFDQAQLESEIDVYVCANANAMCQVCRHDSLAIGGDDGGGLHNNNSSEDDDDDHFKVPVALEDLAQGGFAFALEEDLMCGTTSPCATFTSPALYGKGDKSNVFDVAGLEIWSFTPCHDVKSAEKLEMTQFFIEESTRGSYYNTSSSSRRSSASSSTPADMFTGRDLIQENFYRRVGQDAEGDERRQRWQYANMMNPTGGPRGFGATPRYGYSNTSD